MAGLPNAGKSSLLRRISNAKPKVADYPFTTLAPVLGTVESPDGAQLTVADVPGLIEGASEGIGLGHEFLAHLERARLLLHVIDASEEDVEERFRTIDSELALYGAGLDERPQAIVLNKIDLLPELPVFPVEDERIVGVFRRLVRHRRGDRRPQARRSSGSVPPHRSRRRTTRPLSRSSSNTGRSRRRAARIGSTAPTEGSASSATRRRARSSRPCSRRPGRARGTTSRSARRRSSGSRRLRRRVRSAAQRSRRTGPHRDGAPRSRAPARDGRRRTRRTRRPSLPPSTGSSWRGLRSQGSARSSRSCTSTPSTRSRRPATRIRSS